MSLSIFPVVLIVAALSIPWNGVAARTNTDTVEMLPYPTIFLTNFFRLSCQSNEESSECQTLEGGTCWSPTIGTPTICLKGCNCVSGYLRNSDGFCVTKRRCDTTRTPIDHVEPKEYFLRMFHIVQSPRQILD